jgi:predicted aminopeptidase
MGKLALGQLQLINGQTRLQQAVLREPDAERKALLLEVPGILAFAEEALALHPGKSYTGYFATERKGMTYVLSASRKLQLTAYSWWFPIAGTVEYRSYFDEHDAREAAAKLEAADYDTWVAPSRAYSTLGFFRDPVTTTMLRDGLPGLAEVLIHELAHERLYAPGHTEWNEALATFVGDQGSARYFARSRFDGTSLRAEAERRTARKHELDVLVAGACTELERLYGTKTPRAEMLVERERVFSALTRAILHLYPQDAPETWRMNNARLVHFQRYSASSGAVTKLWQESGGSWRRFWQLADAHVKRELAH